MSFYEEISKYYDYIFPTGKEQVKLIEALVGMPPKTILDIACGTGGYSLELSKKGYDVTAMDLDAKMVEVLKEKSLQSALDIDVVQGSMLELQSKVSERFDLAFCIGNSLVHLENEEEIEKFFKEVKGLLKEGGSLLIQIINYDRIFAKDIRALPTIENQDIGLRFERNYRYDRVKNKIFFKTFLEIEGKKMENEIPLYPILSKDLVKLLKNAGFKETNLYGDFKGNEYEQKDSYALVIVAS